MWPYKCNKVLCVSHQATLPCAVLFTRRHNSKEGGVSLQREGLCWWGAVGHWQLHTLLLPARPDPLLDRQLSTSALRRAHQRGGKLLPNVSRYLSYCPSIFRLSCSFKVKLRQTQNLLTHPQTHMLKVLCLPSSGPQGDLENHGYPGEGDSGSMPELLWFFWLDYLTFWGQCIHMGVTSLLMTPA